MKSLFKTISSLLVTGSIFFLIPACTADDDPEIPNDDFDQNEQKFLFNEDDVKRCPYYDLHEYYKKSPDIPEFGWDENIFFSGIELGYGDHFVEYKDSYYVYAISAMTRPFKRYDPTNKAETFDSVWPQFSRGIEETALFAPNISKKFVIRKGKALEFKLLAIVVTGRYPFYFNLPEPDGDKTEHIIYLDDYEIGEEIYHERYGNKYIFKKLEDGAEMTCLEYDNSIGYPPTVQFVYDVKAYSYSPCEHFEKKEIDYIPIARSYMEVYIVDDYGEKYKKYYNLY